MPGKVRVYLRGEAPASPFQHMSGLRALALGWIGRARPEQSAALHEVNRPKPYALSPLWEEGAGPEDPAVGSRAARATGGGRWWFEVSLLDDRLALRLAEAAGAEREVRLGPQGFEVTSVVVREVVSWEELLPASVPQRPRYTVRLITPTAHHAAGPHRKAVVVPSAETYFASWWNRWNLCATQWECAPFALEEGVLAAAAEQVVIAGFSGGTQLVRNLDPNRHFLGFVGEVVFEVLKPGTLTHGVRASLEALVRLACYAGTGVETMRGMGQTREGRGRTADFADNQERGGTGNSAD